MGSYKVEKSIGNRILSIESNKLARQADGAVTVRYGDTIVLATAVAGNERDTDFFPLTVDYREKTYAAGKFPGGFYKREGRPTAKETLTMRLTDRPLRPLFPKSYRCEVQVMSIVLSADKENNPDILAMIGASAALCISSIPFSGPIASVRVGRVNGEFVLNPTHSELKNSDMDMVLSGSEDGVLMVEAGAKEVSEDDILHAMVFAEDAVKEIVKLQKELVAICGKEKQQITEGEIDEGLYKAVWEEAYDRVKEKSITPGKQARDRALSEIQSALIEKYCKAEGAAAKEKDINYIFDQIERKVVRGQILNENKRVDGRGLDEIRHISCEVGILPMTHGSAVFTRGETQALVVTTLGTAMDEQRVEALEDEYSKKFMLHYNFPPFCVGEVKPSFGPSRREIGHGNLAERALEAVMPDHQKFSYTVRLVSDILESNGSSSMGTVCGGTLCLMDAGVCIKDPVAGIAMGLIKEGDEVRVLSDILGTEDNFGDMDFKVAGTQRGITALQMDLKIPWLDEAIMRKALEQAREGRIHILREMLKVLDKPRTGISDHAPRLLKIKINPDKIGLVIGPGGKNVKRIQEDTGARVEIENDGTVVISSPVASDAEKAKDIIERMTEEVRIGKIYKGKVTAIKEYGAFVEVLPGQDGLLHISEMSDGYIEKVEDAVKMGQEIEVKVIGIDDQKRIRLSRKAVLKERAAGSLVS
ncbi:MAG: polyribonucleotide nucleotidyltransferase [Planctomycetes bacterium RIFCSPHIGHO2_02_FULL_50_42]|nr:MAG: polyribonucleotide nucleotidyltransferase [Planctomycetes bacterium RIFCSPHIGHO2_02_FULL_50_42]OHB95845.1 MAG: polyribonucleotide nucleotidyltransferase [Planctomycetes bacterium RIFCSPLOWO2_02_FULL_50_16]OHC03432.1 MAG: polyribonucleotide nucleotidyltransferase [Planctomycetes bacterium RIFCSPLOWO2_12_FULL_50_35]